MMDHYGGFDISATKGAQTIWMARHATRLDFEDSAWAKQAERPFDSPLAEKGLREARRLAQRLANEPVDVIYSSPFLRAMQTAGPIAMATGAPLRVEPGLGEWLQRDWFTETPRFDHESFFGHTVPQWERTYSSATQLFYPEKWSDVAERVRHTLTRLISDGGNIVLIGHGASIICAAAAILAKAPEEDPPPPHPAALFRFKGCSGQWRSELHADTSHLHHD